MKLIYKILASNSGHKILIIRIIIYLSWVYEYVYNFSIVFFLLFDHSSWTSPDLARRPAFAF